MKFQYLPEAEFDALYNEAFEANLPASEEEKATLEADHDQFDDLLRNSLSKHWVEDACGDADFAISDDWSCSWHHCGGIYSERIMRPLYLDILHDVISTLKKKELWTYHTTVEPAEGNWCGFFMRDGIVYYSDDFRDSGYIDLFRRNEK